jgi:putative two-component system response regulator
MTTKPRILVVDDESFFIDVLENLMRDEYEVVSVNSGNAALKLAFNDAQFDLILLDVVMPNIDGYDVCRQLKANTLTANIPIIFLTMRSDVDDEVRGFNLGCVDYITKPMSPPIVLARVRTHIKLANVCKQLKQLVKQLQDS